MAEGMVTQGANKENREYREIAKRAGLRGAREMGASGEPRCSGQGTTPGSACVRGSREHGARTGQLSHSLNEEWVTEQTRL